MTTTTVYVSCPLCGEDSTASVTDGDARTHDHPGSAPEVDWRKRACMCCDFPAMDYDRFWEIMEELALDEWRGR